uniref:Uncharacterized protein n=1 Tax=Cacopsylla melanoneura TaxID=428564 RepID=A0A8D8R217_9HEMI
MCGVELFSVMYIWQQFIDDTWCGLNKSVTGYLVFTFSKVSMNYCMTGNSGVSLGSVFPRNDEIRFQNTNRHEIRDYVLIYFFYASTFVIFSIIVNNVLSNSSS